LGVAFKQKVIELFRLSKMASSNREEMNRNWWWWGQWGGEWWRRLSSSSCADTGIGLFKEKVIEAPKAGGFEDKRPSKLWNESYSNYFPCLMKLESIFMSKQSQGM
jgi:hypothetical protein